MAAIIALVQLSNLTALDLSSSQIDDQLTEAICKHLPNLTSLTLSNNKITAQGATAIAAGLASLTELSLSKFRSYEDSNNIGDQGLQAIADGLPKLQTLRVCTYGNRLRGLWTYCFGCSNSPEAAETE